MQDLVEEAFGALVLGILEEVLGCADLDYAALVHGEIDVLEDLGVPEEPVHPVNLDDAHR
jgi:hypothetical protein